MSFTKAQQKENDRIAREMRKNPVKRRYFGSSLVLPSWLKVCSLWYPPYYLSGTLLPTVPVSLVGTKPATLVAWPPSHRSTAPHPSDTLQHPHARDRTTSYSQGCAPESIFAGKHVSPCRHPRMADGYGEDLHQVRTPPS